MFTLTEEQINYIIEVYGGTKQVINDIERRLNLLGIIDNEEDYFEIVATVAAQKETIKSQAKGCTTKEDAIRVWETTDKLILLALRDKYNDFSNFSLEVQEKMKSYC